MPPPERTERSRAAPASSSWSFLSLCSQPKVARDLELDDVQGNGHKRWQRELDRMRDHVAGVEGAVQGQIKVYHQQMQECVKRLEKRYVEEIAALRAHLIAGGEDPEGAKPAGVADGAALAAEREALQASLVEVHELRDEVHALQGNVEPRAMSVEPQEETEAFAEIEGFKQRMKAEIESAKQRAKEQDGDSAKEVSEVRRRFLKTMEGMQTRRKPGVSRVDFELERFRLKTAIEMQSDCLEAQSADIFDLKLKLTGMVLPGTGTEEDMNMNTMKRQCEEYLEEGGAREREAQEEFGQTAVPDDPAAARRKSEMLERKHDLLARDEMYAKQSMMMTVLHKEVAVVRAEVEHLHSQSSALESEFSHVKEDLHKAIEASSIKAGYLAGALAGCDEKERKRIYNVLKKREEELQIGRTGQVLYGTAVSSPTTTDAALCFEVEIDRCDGGELGVRFDLSSGIDLEVVEFTGKRSSGLFHKYNVECAPPQTPVAVGDRVVEVNGIRGYASLLMRELETKKVLSMVLQR